MKQELEAAGVDRRQGSWCVRSGLVGGTAYVSIRSGLNSGGQRFKQKLWSHKSVLLNNAPSKLATYAWEACRLHSWLPLLGTESDVYSYSSAAVT